MLALPTTRTAVMLAAARTADSDQTASLTETATRRARTHKRAQVRYGRIVASSPALAERYALRSTTGRSEAQVAAGALLKGTLFGWDRNDDKRTYSLPRIAASMAGKRGRLTPEGIEHLVSSYASQWALFHRAATAFLPEQVTRKQATTFLAVMPGVIPSTTWPFFSPTPKVDASLMRSINPATPRNGGRPHKARSVSADRWGTRIPTVDLRPLGGPSAAPTLNPVPQHSKGFGRGQELLAVTAPAHDLLTPRVLAGRAWSIATDEALSVGRARMGR